MKHAARTAVCCALSLASWMVLFARGEEVPNRIALTRVANGIDGTLVLRTDPRLTKALLKRFGGGGWETIGESDPMYKEFKTRPPKNAVLEIQDARGKVVNQLQLESPVAIMGPAALLPNRWLAFVTVDYSTGSGSSNGPMTFLLEVREGKFQWVEALDNKSRKSARIALMRSLRSDWQTSATPTGRDILALYCVPEVVSGSTPKEQKFLLIYARYHFDGAKWVKYEKSKEGFWAASAQRFPQPSEFPKAD